MIWLGGLTEYNIIQVRALHEEYKSYLASYTLFLMSDPCNYYYFFDQMIPVIMLVVSSFWSETNLYMLSI